MGREGAEAADGQARTTRHKLQEQPLLVAAKRAHDLEQVLDRLAVVRESVIAARALDQSLAVPGHEARAAEQAVELLRVEEPQAAQVEHRVEALAHCLHLCAHSPHQRELGHQAQVLVQIRQVHLGLPAATPELNVAVARQGEVELYVGQLPLELGQLLFLVARAAAPDCGQSSIKAKNKSSEIIK